MKKPSFIPQEMMQAQKAEVSLLPKEDSIIVQAKGSYLPIFQIETLPSKFLAYKPGVEISCQPYKYGELKKFAQSKLTLKQRYEFILEGILVSGMEKKDLTFNDFLFIALIRKLYSIGTHGIVVKFKCQQCDFEIKKHVQLDKLDFEDINVPELPANITINNKDMSFTPFTIGDFFTLCKENKEADPVAIMAVQCRNVPFKESFDLCFNANPEDSEILEEINKVFYHGLALHTIPCTNKEYKTVELIEGEQVEKTIHCTFENKVDLGDPTLMVEPFRGDTEPPKARIRFGSGSQNQPT